jgi:hypothetical protein
MLLVYIEPIRSSEVLSRNEGWCTMVAKVAKVVKVAPTDADNYKGFAVLISYISLGWTGEDIRDCRRAWPG